MIALFLRLSLVKIFPHIAVHAKKVTWFGALAVGRPNYSQWETDFPWGFQHTIVRLNVKHPGTTQLLAQSVRTLTPWPIWIQYSKHRCNRIQYQIITLWVSRQSDASNPCQYHIPSRKIFEGSESATTEYKTSTTPSCQNCKVALNLQSLLQSAQCWQTYPIPA